MDIKAPTEFCKPSITIVEDRYYKDSFHEVYFVYKKGTSELLYVGCGKKGRHKHVFSGSSQNVMLNVCYVFSVGLKIHVFGCKSKEEALKRETEGIEELKPKFNNVAKDQIPSIKVKGSLDVEGLLERFSPREASLSGILSLYHEDPFECQALHPEWYTIIEKLTLEVCQKYSKNKSYLKKLYKTRVAEDAVCAEDQVSRIFQPGNVYTAADIKEYLQSLNIPNAKATTLSRWYVIKRVTKNGVACYRIINRLVDNL